jgi:drug/metabolite transporter (DMT)-like permease
MKHRLTPAQGLVGTSSLLVVGLLYGLSAVITKYLSDVINAYQVIEYRFGIAFLAAAAALALSARRVTFDHIDTATLVAFAVTFPASAILFTLSVFHASVALAVFSFYIANLLSQFALGSMFFHEEIDRYKAAALVVSVASLIAFTNPFSEFTVTSGFLLGLTAGVVQGIASTYQKRLGGSVDTMLLLACQALTGTVMAGVILAFTGEALIPILNGFAWLVTIIFGLSMLAIMYLFVVGYRYTNLNTGSVLVSSELFFAPLFAYLLLAEHVPTNVFIGGVLTAVAAVLVGIPAKPRKTYSV